MDALSSLFSHLVDTGVVDSNLVVGVERPKRPRKPPRSAALGGNWCWLLLSGLAPLELMPVFHSVDSWLPVWATVWLVGVLFAVLSWMVLPQPHGGRTPRTAMVLPMVWVIVALGLRHLAPH